MIWPMKKALKMVRHSDVTVNAISLRKVERQVYHIAELTIFNYSFSPTSNSPNHALPSSKNPSNLSTISSASPSSTWLSSIISSSNSPLFSPTALITGQPCQKSTRLHQLTDRLCVLYFPSFYSRQNCSKLRGEKSPEPIWFRLSFMAELSSWVEKSTDFSGFIFIEVFILNWDFITFFTYLYLKSKNQIWMVPIHFY